MRIVLKFVFMTYNTKNRQIVIEVLKDNKDKHLTIEDIFELTSREVPLASLYRIIDSLTKEGIIRKYIIDNKTSACYQYALDKIEHNHFHLRCSCCGKIIHLECDEVSHLLKHIEEEHNFEIDVTKVILYGLCDSCKKGNRAV